MHEDAKRIAKEKKIDLKCSSCSSSSSNCCCGGRKQKKIIVKERLFNVLKYLLAFFFNRNKKNTYANTERERGKREMLYSQEAKGVRGNNCRRIIQLGYETGNMKNKKKKKK